MTRSLHQASCVEMSGSALIIEGPSGSGKSSLALSLIDRGWKLIGDDGVQLELRGDKIWALPPPNIEGLIEIRNVGLARLPTSAAPISLVIRLDPDAPRFVEEPEEYDLLGHRLPLIRLWPDSPALYLRAEWAGRIYGLR